MALSNANTVPNGTCYSMTGLTSPWNAWTYIPCNLTAIENGQHSACCAPGDTCLTNGLCKYNPPKPTKNFNTYWRIGCTDPTYQDPACPKQCKNTENFERNVHVVFECPGDGEWCCGTGATDDYANIQTVNTTCCNIADLAFRDKPRQAYATALSNWQSEIELQTFAALAESSAASTATSSPLSGSTAPSSLGSTPTASSASLSTASSTSSAASSSSNPVAMGVGLGLGIPLLICVLLAAAFMVYRYKRSLRAQHSRMNELVEAPTNAFAPAEKSGREVPAELSGDMGICEAGGGGGGGRGVYELARPDSWGAGDDGKRLDFRGAEGYR